MTSTDPDPTIERMRASIDAELMRLVPPDSMPPVRLHRSIRHSLLAPGKRIRAVLTLLAAIHFGGAEAKARCSACAVEMIHSASLILDDLPAMDNGTLRRGVPANHCVFGEGTAILAAIALMNRAFGIVAADGALDPAARAEIVAILSDAIGSDGLVAGQEQDLHGRGELGTAAAVEQMHARKTGALFAAAAEIGAVAAGAGMSDRARARRFGLNIGAAFQTFDDLLDRFASEEAALKDIGQDRRKPTLVSLLGPEDAFEAARGHLDAAIAEVAGARGTTALVGFVRAIGDGFVDRLDWHEIAAADGRS